MRKLSFTACEQGQSSIEIKKLTQNKMPSYTEFIDIDIAKNKLAVYETKNKQYFTVTNNKKGIRFLLKPY